MAKILKGKEVADRLTQELCERAEKLKEKNIIPKLAIVRVGENSSDLAYEKGAISRCRKIGIEAVVLALPKDIDEDSLILKIQQLNEDPSIHGILVFRPLGKHLRESRIKYCISPEKDVDCFHPVNSAKLMEGDITGFAPCTAVAVIEILKHFEVPMKGKKAVVLGRSMVIGKPVALLLLNENATVTITHSKTENLAAEVAQADIVIGAIGRAKMIGREYVKEGATIIDVGINEDEAGNLCGDVDFEAVVDKVGAITPVPGGVGSVTTTILAKHVLISAERT